MKDQLVALIIALVQQKKKLLILVNQYKILLKFALQWW